MFELLVTLCLSTVCAERVLPAPLPTDKAQCEASMNARSAAWVKAHEGYRVKGQRCVAIKSLEKRAAKVSETAPGHFVHEGRVEPVGPKNAGDIANTGFIIGAEAVAVIDAGSSRKVAEALYLAVRRQTQLPIRHLLLTHMHPDHTLGAQVFKEAGAEIVGPNTAGGVTVGNELPGAGEADGGGGTVESNNKTEEVVNYEISKRSRTEVQEAGRIKRLSVAVLVDGVYSKDDNDNLTYAPRTEEEIEQITSLVRSAMGFDRARGDSLEVVNLRFAPGTGAVAFGEESEPFLELTKDDYFRLAELAVLGVVGLLVVLLIVRPLLRRALTPEEPVAISDQSGEAAAVAIGEDGETAALPSPEEAERLQAAEYGSHNVSELIDSARLTGQMQESSIRKVAELVKGNPDEAIGIIRQWVQEPARSA